MSSSLRTKSKRIGLSFALFAALFGWSSVVEAGVIRAPLVAEKAWFAYYDGSSGYGGYHDHYDAFIDPDALPTYPLEIGGGGQDGRGEHARAVTEFFVPTVPRAFRSATLSFRLGGYGLAEEFLDLTPSSPEQYAERIHVDSYIGDGLANPVTDFDGPPLTREGHLPIPAETETASGYVSEPPGSHYSFRDGGLLTLDVTRSLLDFRNQSSRFLGFRLYSPIPFAPNDELGVVVYQPQLQIQVDQPKNLYLIGSGLGLLVLILLRQGSLTRRHPTNRPSQDSGNITDTAPLSL
ncbi:hypothetical protein [Rhodovibrio salinarum]|nr:hypothetical protein [Rhodovibrio salinarum]